MENDDYSKEILESEQFNKLRKLQSGSCNVVHENDQIFLNGMFYYYNDPSVEMREYKEEEKKKFVESIIDIVLERYPNLTEKKKKKIASICSDHPLGHKTDILLDIDICTLKFIEENQLTDNMKDCLENIKERLSAMQYGWFNREVYSEDYAIFFITEKLNEHMQDSNKPLLTWGEGRLLTEMNVEYIKQNTASIAL